MKSASHPSMFDTYANPRQFWDRGPESYEIPRERDEDEYREILEMRALDETALEEDEDEDDEESLDKDLDEFDDDEEDDEDEWYGDLDDDDDEDDWA